MSKGTVETDGDESPAAPGWGHTSGFISVGEAQPMNDPATVGDRLLIVERLHRYCWCYDERQLKLLGACFTDDAVWEGSVTGNIAVGPFQGRSAITKWLSEFWPHQHEQRRHMIMNTIVEQQDSKQATTLSYILLMGAGTTGVDIKTSGFYRLKLRCNQSQWQIEHLFAGFDAPFWPGKLNKLSQRGKARHGVSQE